jgi:hypothetical protein
MKLNSLFDEKRRQKMQDGLKSGRLEFRSRVLCEPWAQSQETEAAASSGRMPMGLEQGFYGLENGDLSRLERKSAAAA